MRGGDYDPKGLDQPTKAVGPTAHTVWTAHRNNRVSKVRTSQLLILIRGWKIWLVILGWCAAGCGTPPKGVSFVPLASPMHGCFGTYDGEPRLPNGRVDVQTLLAELIELKANSYNWLIWHGPDDWADLKTFLPLARHHHLNVWVTLVPPSESPPKTIKYSEPFRLDYRRWAAEIGKLSRKEPNLVAWSIDDFCANRKIFTPDEVRSILAQARQANPKLAFIPCCYYRDITPAFAENYGNLCQGILFPYRAESAGTNLKDASKVGPEMQKIRSILGVSMPVIVDVYATPHARYPDGSSPEYVEQVMTEARSSADGVLIYCHQGKKNSPVKFGIIARSFEQWSAQPW